MSRCPIRRAAELDAVRQPLIVQLDSPAHVNHAVRKPRFHLHISHRTPEETPASAPWPKLDFPQARPRGVPFSCQEIPSSRRGPSG